MSASEIAALRRGAAEAGARLGAAIDAVALSMGELFDLQMVATAPLVPLGLLEPDMRGRMERLAARGLLEPVTLGRWGLGGTLHGLSGSGAVALERAGRPVDRAAGELAPEPLGPHDRAALGWMLSLSWMAESVLPEVFRERLEPLAARGLVERRIERGVREVRLRSAGEAGA